MKVMSNSIEINAQSKANLSLPLAQLMMKFRRMEIFLAKVRFLTSNETFKIKSIDSNDLICLSHPFFSLYSSHTLNKVFKTGFKSNAKAISHLV